WHHFQQPAIDLPVQVASMTSGNSYFSIPGKVVPARTDTVNAPFGGPIVKHFREGQRVAEGELLATIGRANIAGDHEIARRALIAAQRESIRASKELSDSNSLPADLVRPEEVARDKRRVARAEQKLAVAQATYAREQARWKDNRVRAPYAGVIVQDKVGAQSSINEAAPIAVVSSGSEQLFVASINGPDGARLHIGQTAQVHI